MASNGVDPTTGFPLFPEEDAPQLGADLEEVAAYAVLRGNALRGTTAERDDFAYPLDGLLWSNTTTDSIDRYDGSGWVRVLRMPSTAAVTFTPPNYAASGSSPVTVRIDNGRAYLEGEAVSTGTLGFTAGTNYTLGSVPAGIAPATNQLYLVSVGPNNSGRLVVQSTGVMIFSVLASFTGVLSMGLAGVNWQVP